MAYVGSDIFIPHKKFHGTIELFLRILVKR